ncbi:MULTISPECIES: hypothetical protein [Pseudoalteromonas]|uniref:hypothetical protein n=1 Tax=Pseudoalteromonas TaxID=53246 RepID=UPI00110C1D9D|nr:MULTISPECIES: hypothetical protein [Pseudoalteromonas]MCG7545541.1 hypothetical protein [Pseudoalteromonas sp. MM17-2]TMP23784.1 hypothetical protein CWC06_09530 [Pseudoalteromonas ruthenica]|tara:strand:- start:8867 stop:9187 length:321 start_codon:yes stop_codon:yes gene_type:complete
MHVFTAKHFTPENVFMTGFVRVDAQQEAERLMFLDRNTGGLLFHCGTGTGIVDRFVPLSYTVDPVLMVVMLDDDAQYSGKIFDLVQATPVDLATFNPADPFPEPGA